jgi:hypothetical protein
MASIIRLCQLSQLSCMGRPVGLHVLVCHTPVSHMPDLQVECVGGVVDIE